MHDLLIINGTVLDPASGFEGMADVAVKNGRIAAVGPALPRQAARTLDAAGQYVTPGLIDHHCHVFYNGSDMGISPDSSYLATGVTTVVDAGTAGSANFRLFREQVMTRGIVSVKAYINMSPTGLTTNRYHEDLRVEHMDLAKLKRLFDPVESPHVPLGLKVRVSREFVGDEGLAPLRKALELAAELNVPVAVHVTNPAEGMDAIANLLRPGDVLVHMYHGEGETILGPDGTVRTSVLEARKRGVVFDAANGSKHWSFAVAEAALRQGFAPDIISTDWTRKTLFTAPVFSLPFTLAKYCHLGCPLMEILRCATSAPALRIGQTKSLGALKIGYNADIALFAMEKGPVTFTDTLGETRTGDKMLVCKATIKNGELVYSQLY